MNSRIWDLGVPDMGVIFENWKKFKDIYEKSENSCFSRTFFNSRTCGTNLVLVKIEYQAVKCMYRMTA